jgi:hypothetical protein
MLVECERCSENNFDSFVHVNLNNLAYSITNIFDLCFDLILVVNCV